VAVIDPVFVDRLRDDEEVAELDIHARLKAASRIFFNTLRLLVCVCTPRTCRRSWMWMGKGSESRTTSLVVFNLSTSVFAVSRRSRISSNFFQCYFSGVNFGQQHVKITSTFILEEPGIAGFFGIGWLSECRRSECTRTSTRR
jgi:hypothetical protein